MHTDATKNHDHVSLDAELIGHVLVLCLSFIFRPIGRLILFFLRPIGRFIKARFHEVGLLLTHFDKKYKNDLRTVLYAYCGILGFLSVGMTIVSLCLEHRVDAMTQNLLMVGIPLGLMPFVHAAIFARRRHRLS